MVDRNTLAFVLQHARRWISVQAIDEDTDLVAVTIVTPQQLQRVLEGIQKDRKLKWPTIPDEKGKQHPAQLFTGDSLTVRELCAIVQSGAWPQSWTRPGKFLQGP